MVGTGIKREHLVGVVVGVGIAAAGYYFYRKNQQKVDEFLKSQGINISTSPSSNYENMDIETLTEVKEHIEDIIAEKEISENIIDSELETINAAE